MVSLPFIFCWRKHIFLMIIKIFIEKVFFSNFWATDPLNMVDPSFFSFLRDLHIDATVVANNYTKKHKWGWMSLNDATDVFFLKSIKNCWSNQKYQTVVKDGQTHNIWEQQHNSFPMRGHSFQSDTWLKNWCHLKVGRRKSWRRLEISVTPYRLPQVQKFCEIARKCVKLSFGRWKVGGDFRPTQILSY